MSIVRHVNFFGSQTPWYGVCAGIGLLAIGMWMLYLFKSLKLPEERQNEILCGFPFMIITGVACALLVDALFTGDWRTWTANGERRIGFTFTGWLFGALLFLFIYGRFVSCGRMFLMNMLLPVFALAQAIGRIGCFLGGCCYGFPCDFGVSYPPGSYPYSMVGPAKVFPVQLVESGCLFALFGLLLCVPFRFRGAVYLLGVGTIRFTLEFFRGDVRGTMFGMTVLSPQQILSIAFFVAGVLLWKQAYDCAKDNLKTQLQSDDSPNFPSVKRKQSKER